MIREQISQIIQDVHDGNESACKGYAMLKELQSVIESGLKVILDPAMVEARAFNKTEVYYGGYWESRSTGTKLDYTKDKICVDLSKDLSTRKKDLGLAWKAKQDGKGFFDNSTGEEIPILPVKTAAKEVLIFKPKS